MGPEQKEPMKERVFEGLGFLAELGAGGIDLFFELVCWVFTVGEF